MEYEIDAILLIEILGRPAEHVASTLQQLIERLGREQDLQVVNKRIYPPKQTEKTQGMFLSFAEVEIKAKTLARLAEICFSYMPSSVEIIKPYELKFTLNDANAVLNLLIARLHNYDSIAKRLSIENSILQNKLKQGGLHEDFPLQEEVKRKGAKKKEKRKGKKSKRW